MRTIVQMMVLHLACTAAYGASCPDLERMADRKVSMLSVAADDLGSFRTIGDDSLDAVKQCPTSERLWYLAARSAEVLEVPMAGHAFAESGGLKRIVADAVSHAPKSAPIATIAARLDGSTVAAREALALDPEYLPARWALVAALANNGSIREALRLCRIEAPATIDHIAKAKVLLAAGRATEAVAEARNALKSSVDRDRVEPTPAIEIQRNANEVLGFALLKLGRRADAYQALQVAADTGSAAAQHQLSGLK